MKIKFYSIAFVGILLCKTNSWSQAMLPPVNVQDSLALVDLYDSTNGPGWVNHTNWLTSNPLRNWYGITVQNGRVTAIKLDGNALQGQIPSSLGNLNALNTLVLGSITITGILPASIGNLTNLDTLDLAYCSLKGKIPSSLGNLTNLIFLNLNFNKFTGSIPPELGNLTNLTNLYLIRNNLTGLIPVAVIGKLKNLTSLSLESNKFSGGIPASIYTLTKLKQLNLSYDQLTGIISDSIGKLVNLQGLDLHSNNFTSVSASIGKLTKLTFLNLGYNQISAIDTSIGNLTQLRILSLSGNMLTRVPASTGKLTKLRELSLSHNLLDSLSFSIKGLINLHELYLDYNKFTRINLPGAGSAIELRHLYLDGNQLSGIIPNSLDSLRFQCYIYLYRNNFTFADLEPFLATRSYRVYYSPQASIHVTQNGSILSAHAGGTLNKNTYKWYKNGVLKATKQGDSTFTISGTGKYNAVVTNSIVYQLTLYSDTITESLLADQKKQINESNSKTFIYPNPANKIFNLRLSEPADSNTYCMLLNIQGKIILRQKISEGSLTQQFVLTDLKPGSYVLIVFKDGRKINEEKLIVSN